MSDDNNGPGRRPAKDVKGLLRFCMEATRSEDAQGTTIVEPMTEEVSSLMYLSEDFKLVD